MSLGLYTDHNVPATVSNGLRLLGVDVLTAAEDEFDTAADDALLDRARALDRVVFTQDEDFLKIATGRQRSGIPFNGVIYVKQNRLTVRAIIDDIELFCKVFSTADVAERIFFLPL
jgi:predicted nuclease of predicted toxin-antitoxin system